MNKGILKQVTLMLMTSGLLSSGVGQATLLDRGGGLLYDDVQNITWLQDANYAKTSGYDSDGLMTWNEANAWAGNLVYHDSVRNTDYADWRLTSHTPVNGIWNYASSVNGPDIGYNITSPTAELSYMYHVNLGLKGPFTPAGDYEPNTAGVFGNGSFGGQADVGLVKNLQQTGTHSYWASDVPPFMGIYVLQFATNIGAQFLYAPQYEGYAWAVRPGDVAVVPEPEAYAMFLAGLGLMGFMARRRKAS